MQNKVTVTAIRPLGHDTWYIDGDSLEDIPFARLIAPEGVNYRTVSHVAYLMYHGRDGVRAAELDFALKPLVSEWHSAILFQPELHKYERIRLGWIDYDPGDTNHLVWIGWGVNPELLKGLLRYNLSNAYWEKFLNHKVIPSPFHSFQFEGWKICRYDAALWQKIVVLMQQIDALQEELKGLLDA